MLLGPTAVHSATHLRIIFLFFSVLYSVSRSRECPQAITEPANARALAKVASPRRMRPHTLPTRYCIRPSLRAWDLRPMPEVDWSHTDLKGTFWLDRPGSTYIYITIYLDLSRST